MSEQHSPLPWRVEDSTEDGGIIEVASSDGESSIAQLAPYDLALQYGCADDAAILRGRANAEFIVRACNSHEALVAALKDVIARLDYVFATGEVLLCDDAPARFSELEAAVRAALAKAEATTHV